MQITAEIPYRTPIAPSTPSLPARSSTALPGRASRATRVAASHQTTLNEAITCVGTGLHSGAQVRMTLHPAEAGHGIVFRRTDCGDTPLIPALYDHVVDTRLSTVIAHPDAPSIRVATIEHLMAALHANRVDNALIDIDGPETPVLDGSAAEFDFLLQCAGSRVLDAPRAVIEILRHVVVEEANGAFAELRPARSGLALAMSIDFDASVIGQQRHAMPLTPERFRQEVSFCRTFVDRQEIEALRKIGLARGGSLDNAIVVDGDGVLNPCGLRHPKEFVRHKLMDAVGDLYLAGHTLQAGFMGHKSGHGLNNRLLRAVFASQENWRLVGTDRAAAQTLAVSA
ncbi:UDP-3-O-acyl-N-acetylglucosamine deacetylase [Swaminathania salitolerans]|uniref:UDP-3-O-acyl-N-acetylglucosamine deacetylase n=1 Tax=Swaminathania salitolerans TaxID=182838 RepID=A0A511BPJ1_9PROT|nr:UDP-3-O-acyl-N-acetylglucosamine deacetylase [Swaminathania salitolerans]GBQ10984.1 UDP-3-O-[3-hydroxymyristoyl] N-acetylglucosamine deacetylase [Swaminathania salitolerans LMG 21291]GEL02256.1 UDP-3-O-acyl-N-acetylglucosamine deacetylase [Swaminathania salitolerans]